MHAILATKFLCCFSFEFRWSHYGTLLSTHMHFQTLSGMCAALAHTSRAFRVQPRKTIDAKIEFVTDMAVNIHVVQQFHFTNFEKLPSTLGNRRGNQMWGVLMLQSTSHTFVVQNLVSFLCTFLHVQNHQCVKSWWKWIERAEQGTHALDELT